MALGAVGFADKTEELLKRGEQQTEAQVKTRDSSADKQKEHLQHQQPAEAELHNHDLMDEDLTGGHQYRPGTTHA